MSHVHHDPPSTSKHREFEQIDAWRAALQALYLEYPDAYQPVSHSFDAEHWRVKALKAIDVYLSYKFACDTGLDEEELKSVFMLIFGGPPEEPNGT